jgi:hypothetical protein
MSNLKPSKPPGQLAVVYLKVTITAGFVAVVFMALLIAGYCKGKDINLDKDKDSILEFTLKTITAGLAIVSGVYVGDSIRSVAIARSDEEKLRKIDRSLKLIERWNSPSYNQLRTLIERETKTIREQEADKDRYAILVREKMLTDADFKTCASDMLNFLEEVAHAVRGDLADEGITKSYFAFIFSSYAAMFSNWIQYRQDEAVKHHLAKPDVAKIIYMDFLYMHERWNNNNK